jgi:hypothetical protein
MSGFKFTPNHLIEYSNNYTYYIIKCYKIWIMIYASLLR